MTANEPAATSAALVPVPCLPPGSAYARPHWLRRTAGRVAQVILPSAILAAARWWHGQGAAHSIGDAALSAVFATAALAVGGLCALSGQHLTRGAAAALSAGATLAMAGVVAYTDGMALPALLWTISVGLAVKLADVAAAAAERAERQSADEKAARAAENAEFERRDAAAHRRRMERQAARDQAAITVAALDAFTQVSVAELKAAAAVSVAELQAGMGHAILPGVERPALPAQAGRREMVAMLAPTAPATYQVEQILDASAS